MITAQLKPGGLVFGKRSLAQPTSALCAMLSLRVGVVREVESLDHKLVDYVITNIGGSIGQIVIPTQSE